MSQNPLHLESLQDRRLLSVTLPPIHLPGTDTTLFVPLFQGPGAGAVTRHGPTNGDFSGSPDFTGWSTAGNDLVQSTDFHSIPDGKTTQADISNAQQPNNGTTPVAAASLETFLNLTGGALSSTAKPAIDGSAIKQNITAKAGDTVSFKADFLTNEAAKGGAGDYAFVTITLNGKTQLYKITGTLKATNPLDGSNFTNETGYHNYVIVLPKNGTYTIGYGVVDVTDSTISSALLIDNVQLKPRLFDFGDLFDRFGCNTTTSTADTSGLTTLLCTSTTLLN